MGGALLRAQGGVNVLWIAEPPLARARAKGSKVNRTPYLRARARAVQRSMGGAAKGSKGPWGVLPRGMRRTPPMTPPSMTSAWGSGAPGVEG